MSIQANIKLKDKINMNFFVSHSGEVRHTSNVRRNCVSGQPQGFQEKANLVGSQEQEWIRAGLLNLELEGGPEYKAVGKLNGRNLDLAQCFSTNVKAPPSALFSFFVTTQPLHLCLSLFPSLSFCLHFGYIHSHLALAPSTHCL